jgi:hypothetical protein
MTFLVTGEAELHEGRLTAELSTSREIRASRGYSFNFQRKSIP